MSDGDLPLPIKFIVYSKTNAKTIAANAGQPEYSYYFILKSYLPFLEEIGEVHTVYEPETEVDKAYAECQRLGQPCVFLHFSAPQNFIPNIQCPTIHVIAWEYSTIPTESWANNEQDDWRIAFDNSAAVIAISSYTIDVLKETMGADYPSAAIPCPVWDNMERFRARQDTATPLKDIRLDFDGVLIDSYAMNLKVYVPSEEELKERYRRDDEQMLGLQETHRRLRDREKELKKEWAHINAYREYLRGEQVEAVRHAKYNLFQQTLDSRGSLKSRLGLLFYLTRTFFADGLIALGLRSAERTLQGGLGYDRANLEQLDWFSDVYEENYKRASADEGLVDKEMDAYLAQDTEEDDVAEEDLESDSVISNSVQLKGYIYTAIINPYDGRKNWQDMVVAFCWAFKDTEDATLVLKVSARHVVQFADELVFHLQRLAPFKCRVIAIDAYLDEDAYDKLLEGTTYYVNTSYGEGQSIPLCEALSAGIPAVTSNHTAMRDYVFEDACFIFKSNAQLTHWQHDARKAFRCLHFRPDWLDLVKAYRDSYDTAKNAPDTYVAMGARAAIHLKGHCSLPAVKAQFSSFLDQYRDIFHHQTTHDAVTLAHEPRKAE